MPLAVKREPFTYHDLEHAPDDGKIREVIHGELYVTAAPSTRHQRLVTELVFLIRTFLQTHPLGVVIVSPVEVVFSEQDAVQPDVVFISHARRAIIAEKRLMGPPDWVIEVLSASTRERDLDLKRKLYAAHGLVYWALDPEANTLIAWDEGGERRYGARDEAGVSVLPGFRLHLAGLFEAL
ncbi:MAG: Uma2 family endonuclease [Truepera sp.]|nr:Uma2 family endonuclease [Truepera sp.]